MVMSYRVGLGQPGIIFAKLGPSISELAGSGNLLSVSRANKLQIRHTRVPKQVLIVDMSLHVYSRWGGHVLDMVVSARYSVRTVSPYVMRHHRVTTISSRGFTGCFPLPLEGGEQARVDDEVGYCSWTVAAYTPKTQHIGEIL